MPSGVYKKREKEFVLVIYRERRYYEKKFASIFRADTTFQSYREEGVDCSLHVAGEKVPLESFGFMAKFHYQDCLEITKNLSQTEQKFFADKECAHRRCVDSCGDCIRYEKGECKKAKEYQERKEHGKQ